MGPGGFHPGKPRAREALKSGIPRNEIQAACFSHSFGRRGGRACQRLASNSKPESLRQERHMFYFSTPTSSPTTSQPPGQASGEAACAALWSKTRPPPLPAHGRSSGAWEKCPFVAGKETNKLRSPALAVGCKIARFGRPAPVEKGRTPRL